MVSKPLAELSLNEASAFCRSLSFFLAYLTRLVLFFIMA